MKIAIDCDDVLADSVSLLKEVYYQRHGIIISELSPVWQEWPQLLGEIKTKHLLNIFLDSEFLSNIRPIKGAIEGIHKLASLQYQISIITSRSLSKEQATKNWISIHFGNNITEIIHQQYLDRITVSMTKAELCQKNHISLFIEDNPVMIEEARKAGQKTIIFDQPWNRHIPECPLVKRAQNWEELVEVILKVSH